MNVNKDDAVLAFRHTLEQIIDSKFDMSIDWTKIYQNALDKLDRERSYDD